VGFRLAFCKLFIVAAGEPDVIDACLPLFDAMGQKTIPIGRVPQAAILVKLSGNFLIASVMEALSEALALIRKAGIDPHRYFELLTSTLFTGPVFTKYGGLQQFTSGLRTKLGVESRLETRDRVQSVRKPL
jgi:3-hydroxyisobutyrate dehydrogenase-like beta-hydroxyacid dehydrogenase